MAENLGKWLCFGKCGTVQPQGGEHDRMEIFRTFRLDQRVKPIDDGSGFVDTDSAGG